jgi:hypothetical protein
MNEHAFLVFLPRIASGYESEDTIRALKHVAAAAKSYRVQNGRNWPGPGAVAIRGARQVDVPQPSGDGQDSGADGPCCGWSLPLQMGRVPQNDGGDEQIRTARAVALILI